MTEPRTRTRILVVDDHPAMRHGLSQLISGEEGLEICGEAEDRRSMIAVIEKSPPDLVVLDIGLKDRSCSGLDLIEDIKARLGEIPILVFSMHDEALYAERAFRAGARGYLMKRESVREVIVAIRRILAGGVYASDGFKESLVRQHVGSRVQDDDGDPATRLTCREFEVFRLIGEGLQPREISEALFVSTKTVETHRINIRRKLGLRNAAELTRLAVKWVHRET